MKPTFAFLFSLLLAPLAAAALDFEMEVLPALQKHCLDHTQLTWNHLGRDFRLTNVYGWITKEILA